MSHSLLLLQPAFEQLLCPSRHFIHYFLHSASLHLLVAVAIASRQGIPKPATNQGTGMPAFRGPSLQYLLISSRYAPSFIHFSSVQSTRCICSCARLAACPGCGFVMVFVHSHDAIAETKTHAKPLRLTVAVYRRTGSLSSTVAGTRRQFRRSSSIAFEASSPASVWTSMPHG